MNSWAQVGVSGYPIEDHPGAKKCGHQGGKVLVAEDEQIKRLNAAQFQLDVMNVPGLIVARTDAEAATLLDGRGDERDQPFILGATSVEERRPSQTSFGWKRKRPSSRMPANSPTQSTPFIPTRCLPTACPLRSSSELLELRIVGTSGNKLANVIFSPILDRKGHTILSVRDQNTFDEALRKKRLMTLIHLFLVHRFKASSVHYVSPTEDNRYQTAKMKTHGIFSEVRQEVGQIIVANINGDRIKELLNPHREALKNLVAKQD